MQKGCRNVVAALLVTLLSLGVGIIKKVKKSVVFYHQHGFSVKENVKNEGGSQVRLTLNLISIADYRCFKLLFNLDKENYLYIYSARIPHLLFFRYKPHGSRVNYTCNYMKGAQGLIFFVSAKGRRLRFQVSD